jgi:hypothetical protein
VRRIETIRAEIGDEAENIMKENVLRGEVIGFYSLPVVDASGLRPAIQPKKLVAKLVRYGGASLNRPKGCGLGSR